MLDEHACSRASKRKANVDKSQECNEEKKSTTAKPALVMNSSVNNKEIGNEGNKCSHH